VAMTTFWRTFHHDGKISQAWWGWGVHAHPLTTITSKVVVSAPAERADTLPLFLLYPYMYSVVLPSRDLRLPISRTPIRCTYSGSVYHSSMEKEVY
jgi:hypothetical protein